MMKKWTCLVLTLLLAAVAACALAEYSGTWGENITWTLDDQGLLTISGEGMMDEATGSQSWAVHPWRLRQAIIKKLVIEKGITVIASNAFRGCDQMESVSIPDSVTEIKSAAFNGCQQLEEVVIPDSVTEFGSAFCGSGIRRIVLPAGITSIPKMAFENCRKLEEFTVPNGVTDIGESAFEQCDNLKKIIIPDSVTSIGSFAFKLCTSLEEITIPDSVTSTGQHLFNGCENLKQVDLSNGQARLSWCMFCECTALEEITIPDCVIEIDYGAFSQCSSLRRIVIPENVKEIGQFAFTGCAAMEEITFQARPVNIQISAFNNCNSLAAIHVPACNTKVINFFWELNRGDALVIGPHAGLTVIPAAPPTCTEDGSTEGSSCSVCGATITAVQTVPATGHDWKKPKYTWAEDYKTVTASRVCRNDHEHIETETVKTTYKVIREATTRRTGIGRYTSKEFKNEAFSVVSKKVTIPRYPTSATVENGKYRINDDLTAVFTAPAKASLSSVTIPDTITVNGKKVKVVGIADNAFRDNKKVKNISIGKNVKEIGKDAFNGCGWLKTITVKTTKLTDKNVSDGAFSGISRKTVFKCPKKKLSAYRKLFIKKGAPETCQFIADSAN